MEGKRKREKLIGEREKNRRSTKEREIQTEWMVYLKLGRNKMCEIENRVEGTEKGIVRKIKSLSELIQA